MRSLERSVRRLSGRFGAAVAVGLAAFALGGCGPGTPTQAQAAPGGAAGASGGEGASKKAARPATVSEPTDPAKRTIPNVRTVNAYPELVFHLPLWVGTAPDKRGRVFVLEQSGKMVCFLDKPDAKQEDVSTVIDLSAKVYRGHNEEGLLALAFHPDFAKNRYFYLYYSLKGERVEREGRRPNQERFGILSRFTMSEKDPNLCDPSTEVEIMRVPQPWGNHNGAELVFGPDKMLYFSLGDGGAAADPFNHSQNLSTLLGTVLRIDVNKEADGKKYAVPKDNPFVGRPGACPEIWAYGLRNVWRMSFDTKTGELWGGDVGQNAWEEIDIIEKGGNYGWRVREGAHAFNKKDEAPAYMIDPVVEYVQSNPNGRSVTGGFVLRGTKLKGLEGVYLFGDYQSGRMWGVKRDKGVVTEYSQVADTGARISSFGFNTKGDYLICNHLSRGALLRVEVAETEARE